jgi:hypothetical protein
MKLASLILSVLICISGGAQNVYSDTSSTIVGYWKKGERKNLQIIHSKQQSKGNEKIKVATSTYDVELLVLDSTAKNYTLQWTYKNIEVKNSDDLTKRMASLTDGLRVIYKTDDLGSFEEVVNLEEVQAFVNKSLDLISSKSNDSLTNSITSRMRLYFNKREAIESLVLKEIKLYHTLYGNEFSLNSKIVQEIVLPNITGGAPFPATIQAWLSKLQPQNDFCQVIMDQQIDKVKGKEVLVDVIKKLLGELGDKALGTDIPGQIEVSDHNEFDMILSTGWISRVILKRTVKVLLAENIEDYHISLKQ